MRKNTIKQKMAAVLCMAMLFGQTVPVALGEDLVTLITPAGGSNNEEQGNADSNASSDFGSNGFGFGFPGGFGGGFGGFAPGFGGYGNSGSDGKDDDNQGDNQDDAGAGESSDSGLNGFGSGFPGGFGGGFGGFAPGFGGYGNSGSDGNDDDNQGDNQGDNQDDAGAGDSSDSSSNGFGSGFPGGFGGGFGGFVPGFVPGFGENGNSGSDGNDDTQDNAGAGDSSDSGSNGFGFGFPGGFGGSFGDFGSGFPGGFGPGFGDSDDEDSGNEDAGNTPELIVPITPPSSGGAELITPPSSGGVELITPPSSDSSGQEAKAFTIRPMVYLAQVSVVINGASSREIEIELLDRDGKEIASSSIIGDGMVKLGEFANGSYTVRAQYVTPIQNADGSFDFKTVTEKITVRHGLAEQPEQEKPIDIQAKIEKGKDYIIITVTESNDRDMFVSVEGQADKKIVKGVPVRYEGLTPGQSYGVEIDYAEYIEGAKRFTQTVTLDQPATLGKIWITAVTPGTNKLIVSGMAAPGQQLILTTKPAAAADVYAMADLRGVFRAEIACAAGVYTAVTAKYSADMSNSHTASGNWVVSAPAAKPTLTVDSIDITSTTVIAKTTAGVIVEIKTGDYTQKVTADENGIVRFSLPHTYAKNTEFTFVVYYGNWQFFVQTAKVSGVDYLGTLEYGDEGDAVRKLTRRLAALGYPVEETGRYGSTVREAVRLFQRANGLDDDGIAGKKTQQALFSVSAIAYGAGKYPTLVRGDRDYALIYTLQQRLKDLGYYTIKVDGIFGSGTQRAVREFQRVNGLSVTGKADNATQQLLYSSAAKPAGSSSGIPSSYETLSRSGKYKSAVVPLQKRLRELGYYSGNIDGYFGSQTYRAVRNFQSRNGLTVTGVADAYTQQILYSASAKTYSGSTASSGSTSSGYRLLYWGCRGDAVKRLQNALINAGYKSLVRTADGIFGQWTYDAVRAYQKDHGLAVDGIAGRNTQNSLYGTKY